MVIAEALNEIKDKEKLRQEAYQKMIQNVFILPDDQDVETVETCLEEFRELTSEIADLRVKLMIANTHNNIEADMGGKKVTMTLAAALKTIETLRYLEGQFEGLSRSMDNRNARFFSPNAGRYGMKDETIKMVPNFKVSAKEVREQAWKYREEARKMERALIKANWSVEV